MEKNKGRRKARKRAFPLILLILVFICQGGTCTFAHRSCTSLNSTNLAKTSPIILILSLFLFSPLAVAFHSSADQGIAAAEQKDEAAALLGVAEVEKKCHNNALHGKHTEQGERISIERSKLGIRFQEK